MPKDHPKDTVSRKVRNRTPRDISTGPLLGPCDISTGPLLGPCDISDGPLLGPCDISDGPLLGPCDTVSWCMAQGC